MTSRQDLKVVFCIMLLFLIMGIASYASFSPPAPEEPVRLMFQNAGGKVLFTHQIHTEDYGLECSDCHHNLEDDEVYSCRECHEQEGDGDLPSITDALHTTCKGCHEDGGAGPVECESCHRNNTLLP
ncbi:MAG: cytochrome C [Desulfobacterales bacterium]|nr:MAG: cytochrome C [Desulfobacterales bacterium]